MTYGIKQEKNGITTIERFELGINLEEQVEHGIDKVQTS